MDKKRKTALMQGAIPAHFIGESIEKHSSKTTIGAHQLFLGQVRADRKGEEQVVAIEFTAYEEMAEQEIHRIREAAFRQFDISCLHVYHSLGKVKAGEICFFVFVSSPHRKAATDACTFLVENIKASVPIFGKEWLGNATYAWKKNKTTHD
jgi:molybdopterin synthase catalytic subunit